MKKKILAGLLVLVFIFTACGCGAFEIKSVEKIEPGEPEPVEMQQAE